jgi:hypothetical protein
MPTETPGRLRVNKDLLELLLDPDLKERYGHRLNDPRLRQHLWVVIQIRWTRSLAARKAEW